MIMHDRGDKFNSLLDVIPKMVLIELRSLMILCAYTDSSLIIILLETNFIKDALHVV